MSSVLKALLGVFVCAVVGVFVMLALERYNLAHARLTEDVRVTVGTPGRSAEAAEKEVAQPLEDALARVKGLESIRSTITSGLVVIDVRATAIGVDAPNPVTLAQQAVGAVRNQLPRDLDQPLLQRVELNPTTHHFLARSETLSRLELSRWLDEVFRRQVEVQRGVAETRFCGVVRPELKITLDQQKLLALGLRSTDVVAALQASSAEIPAGSLNSNGMALNLRAGTSSVESLQDLELQGQQVRLRDVAMLESGADQGRCWTGPSVLVSVQMFAPAELTLPTHPAVKLTPFTALRTATYLSPPGNSVQATMQALAKLYPDAVITAEGDRLVLLFPEEPRLEDVPGLALRSVDDHHTVVQVSGPDLEQLSELLGKLRDELAKEKTRWLGSTWPQLAPEQVITPTPGVKDVAQTLSLAIVGVQTGRLADGTRIVVRAGTSLDDALLPDGRPLRDVVAINVTLAPAAILRVNRQRTVELELGLDLRDVQRVVNAFPLPAGVSVTVTETN